MYYTPGGADRPILEQNRKRCNCEESGCLETIASPTAIGESIYGICSAELISRWNALTVRHRDRIIFALIMQAASEGDLAVEAVVQNATRKLSDRIKAVYTLDPLCVFLNGKTFEQPCYLYRKNPN